LAGAVAVRIGGIRPSELLGVCEGALEDLLLDSLILSKLPSEEEEMSLAEEIRKKRREILARKMKYVS